MVSKRILGLIAVLGFAAAITLGAWIAGSRIESPADAAARTAPPPRSPILVPVERRVLSSNIVTRGTARFGLPQKISIVPSALKPAPGLIASLPLRNTQLQEGSVLFTASGRPVFMLQGRVPAYRDMVPGSRGEDVLGLEQALLRLGLRPGEVDGLYDAQTSAAVARLYTSRKWEPFGPTRDQVAAVAALERDWGEANKARVIAAATLAAAELGVASARAAADHNLQIATAEMTAKRANVRRLMGDDGTPLALESEQSRAVHANTAAVADLAAQIADRALIVLDPRQPATARMAADAKLELARAAVRKTQLDGEMAVRSIERDVELLRNQVALAEAAIKATRLEGQKTVQAALDAQKLAAIDTDLSSRRAERLAADLAAARSRIGVQVPADEIVFIPAFPVRVEEVTAAIGGSAAGPVLSVTDNQLAIDSSLTLDAAPLVKPGMPVAIDEQNLGVAAKGVVQQVASAPGTRGVDGYHIYFEVRVTEASMKLEGYSLRLTIPTESTKGPVLAVPTSALSLAADGTSRVQVQEGTELKYVTVKPGLAANGYVEVMPLDAALAPGQAVVVGHKTADRKEPQ